MFNKVLVANRGEIACRIIRTLQKMGITAVAIYSEADRHAAHVQLADEAYCVGGPAASESYLCAERIVELCRAQQVDAVHPGYGFLSENTDFASALADAGVVFIGPNSNQINQFGLKHTARELAKQSDVPLLPGTNLIAELEQALTAAEEIGYPVMLKSTAGGGGIGLQLCNDRSELTQKFESVRRLSQNNFSNSGVFIEKYVAKARHIEVQIFGDGKGEVIALGERDCSLQRRNQKVIEETPAPGLTSEQRKQLANYATKLAKSVNYSSAGTVEFIYDTADDKVYFLEVNTRLQVEHGVTEEVFGVDLVAWMVLQAAGELAPLRSFELKQEGAAIEVRIYAEDPGKDFQPSSGTLTSVVFPEDCRVDGWVATGSEISPFYDPLLSKLIVKGQDRAAAVTKLQAALGQSAIYGIETNLAYLQQIAQTELFHSGQVHTKALDSLPYQTQTIDVVLPGAQSSLQDYPGRLGYWNIGVPPSGPMDHYSFRLLNRIVGNPEGACGLELTLTGPTLVFNCETTLALGGAPMRALLDNEPLPLWTPVTVRPGQTLELSNIEGAGQRSYLAVRNGFDAPDYLGSKATFSLGRFGGHSTSVLRAGDVLRIAQSGATNPVVTDIDPKLLPELSHTWFLKVFYGPHGAPDFFTQEDIATFFDTAYEVHFNSARTGVRLIGPKPSWARDDGGEAGLHPSNIHDNAYAIGTVDFTGDMPIILGPDGPSLGGFVCPATIIQSDLWKIGQLKPGDKVHFVLIAEEDASALRSAQDKALAQLEPQNKPEAPLILSPQQALASPILRQGNVAEIATCYRRCGDDYLLIEFGEAQLDLNLRFRVHTLQQWIEANRISGIIDLTPGIRSLQIHYDSRVLPCAKLMSILTTAERELPPIDEIVVPSRTVYLPLSWDDEQTQLAIRKYQELVYPEAPWCPSNIEFIRRINGLKDEQAVKDVLYNADYMVLGLGDVYLGAPVATPVDPRQRLVTTKYNPARTWTPENAVGIGGAYMCIYGMEGPGGYQFVGRTIQMWNRFRTTNCFPQGKPWLLEFFDRIRFFPVSAEELLDARERFPQGEYDLRIEEEQFSLKEYNQFLSDNSDSIAAFKQHQQSSFEAERQYWTELGLAEIVDEPDTAPEEAEPLNIPDGCFAAPALIPGNVWQIKVEPGTKVSAGDTLLVVESMKMELDIKAHKSGIVRELLCQPGQALQAGQAVAIVEEV
jgi:urea carboxylase